MANDFTNVLPKLLAQMLPALRANSILPRLVNRDFDSVAADPGATINVPLPPVPVISDVTAAITPPANADHTPSTVAVNLSNWKEGAFYLTDKEQREVMDGYVPRTMAVFMAGLVDAIDLSILTAMDVGAATALGTAGTAPLATLALAIDPMTKLNEHKVPMNDRHVVINAAAHANALALSGFSDMQFTGDVSAMTAGTFGGNSRIGAKWWLDQNIASHVNGSNNGAYQTNGTAAIGATSITVDTGSGTGKAGDVITFAGDTNRYVVAADFSSGATTITINSPGLKAAQADNVVISIIAAHKSNFAFQRDSIVFVSRAFAPSASAQLSQVLSDPVSGLNVRLEVTRQHKQDRWSIDGLWGTKVVRPDGIIKIMG